MYSKRQLYKPAPKRNVDKKKVRKLVQGRLISSTSPGPVVPGPDTDDVVVVDNNLTSHRQSNEDSVQDLNSSRNYLSIDDPAMTPKRSVPSVTEYISPRAEPLSRSLDLSDTEVSLSAGSNTSHLQPVMVCDASHLASSSDHTEVEVVVNYEDSPARVICHTAGRLEKSLLSNMSSPRSVTNKNGPAASVIVESPRTIRLSSSRNLFHTQDSRDNKNSSKSDNPLFISDQSRGIIREILAEEMGRKAGDSISLSSQQSSPSNLPRSSSPLELPKSISPSSLSNLNSNASHVPGRSSAVESSSPKAKEIPKPIFYPNLKQDINVSNSRVKGFLQEDRIDRTPKIAAAKAAALKQSQRDSSDSETCSLYEYVPQQKAESNIVHKDQKSMNKENKEKSSQEKANKPRSSKKSRFVASRYMQSAASTSNLSAAAVLRDSHSDSVNSQSGKQKTSSSTRVKQNLLPNKTAIKTTTNKLANQSKRAQPSPASSQSNLPKKGKNNLTSTPTNDHSCYPCAIDMSSILQTSTQVTMDSSELVNLTKPCIGPKKSKPSSEEGRHENDQMKLDLLYNRYLQALLMTTEAKRRFQYEEGQAVEQMNGLWSVCESKRVELARTKQEVERLKSLIQIDDALDKTESQLESLEEKLPQVFRDYSGLCGALNTTRHQIGMQDMHIPNKTEEEREAYEDKLESTLKESERLLNVLSGKLGTRLPPLHEYVASLKAISGNVTESGEELCLGHQELEVAQGLCSQLSSRMVLDMQNSHP